MRYLPNEVKNKLNRNKSTFGSWINMPSLVSVEIMARSGFEFLVIDGEHSCITSQTMQSMVMVMEGYGVFPFIRVEENNAVPIKKALDTGCYGVIIPMINNKHDLMKAIDSVYYYPKGKRGVGLSRAQGYGLEFERYKKWYRKNISVIAQIEHIEAINNLDEILSSKEIDATIIGPYDLSASVGYPGDFNRKEVKNALANYEKVSRKYKKPTGYHIVHPDEAELKQKIRKNYKFLVYGIDEIFLAKGCSEAGGRINKLKAQS